MPRCQGDPDAVREHTSAGREVFDDELVGAGLLYWLAILGEAANPVSKALGDAHAEVPWRRIVNQRNILVHVYDRLDVGKV